VRSPLPLLLVVCAFSGGRLDALQDEDRGARARVALETEPRPGNVLVLLADDLGADQLWFYRQGSDYPPTPNLARMAANGVVFTNARPARCVSGPSIRPSMRRSVPR
jgi:hypothetical protein